MVRSACPTSSRTHTLDRMPTTAYLNARQFRHRQVRTGAGTVFATDEPVGPIHAVAARTAEDDTELRAVCGVAVIASLPVWWPPARSTSRVCPECCRLAG